jgi:type III restriction enzyme
MIILKNYQDEAVKGLLKETYSLLKLHGARFKLVFKAPTGAGKTVTMAAYLNQLCEEISDKTDVLQKKLAFIWIAPNQLHLQSFSALKNYFTELRSIKPIQFDEITEGRIKPNEVLFLNWQSINKGGNLFIKDNESNNTLINYVNQSRLHDTEIIVILDEAHLFATKGKAAGDLLQKIYSKIEIDVSATPVFNSDYQYNIKRQEVIDSEMIKRGVILNPNLDAHLQHGKSLNQVLIDVALKKRQELVNAYQKVGANINPLLLIQLPNDTKTESALDNQIRNEVESFLELKGLTTQNHKLAIWLSNVKTNLDGIESPDNMVEVLLFKQAIALGWDCPRASVLLIFREIQQEAFTIQTVGRILRMPEQKHYTNSALNYGYVYTNLSKDIIKIVQDDLDYIVQNKAIRISDYKPIELKSSFINTRLVRNRLSSVFRRCFYLAAEEFFGVTQNIEISGSESIFYYNTNKLRQKFISLDINQIEIPIPRDVIIEIEIGVVRATEMERFAKTQSELDILFRQFSRQNVDAYAPVDSAPILELALKLFFEEYLNIDEFSAVKIILYEQNKPRFIEIIDRALLMHEKLLEQKAALATKRVEESNWDVPSERIYNENYADTLAQLHALEPFYEYKLASGPEKKFVQFLEDQKEHIDWWYKNGDKNKEDFAITYRDRTDIIRAFYIDFVIKLKSGKIALFDTKTLDSDPEFCNKHNALVRYISEQKEYGRQLIGGVIVQKTEGVWKFPGTTISNASNMSGWLSFDPALVK